MISQENRSDSAKGYKKHIEKNIERILLKLSDRTDKWGSDFLIHINNAKRHSNLCRRKNGRIYAPLPIKRAYMNEIWLSELPPPAGVDTQELLNFVIDNDGSAFKKALKGMAPSMETEVLEMWFVLMTNLYKAVDALFGSDFDEKPLSEELVLSIHLKVADEVLDNAGEYREVEVAAAGSSVIYESPKKIRPRLNALIEVINTHICKAVNLESAAALGGFFLSEFLLIHPFRDGNGRTSRLLLSHLLRHWTVVPISLYLRSNREYYIKTMQSRTTNLPLDVITYVAQCIEETVLLHYREQLDSVDDGSVPTDLDSVDDGSVPTDLDSVDDGRVPTDLNSAEPALLPRGERPPHDTSQGIVYSGNVHHMLLVVAFIGCMLLLTFFRK